MRVASIAARARKMYDVGALSLRIVEADRMFGAA